MVILIHQEIHPTVVIIIVPHVVHLILDLFHPEMVDQHIIVIIILLIIHFQHIFLHHQIEQVAEIVANQIIMIIIHHHHHHLDLIDHQIIVKYIHRY
jgi:hypothetical protein